MTPDIRIDEVNTQVDLAEPIGPLSPEDVERLVRAVLERLDDRQLSMKRNAEDRAIRDRSYVPDWKKEQV